MTVLRVGANGKISYSDAVSVLGNGTCFSTENNEIIAWDISEKKTGVEQPTKAEIDAKLIEMQTLADSQKYARKRQTEYPSVGDQLDMLMKDMRDGTKTHQEACEAVKAQFPKP